MSLLLGLLLMIAFFGAFVTHPVLAVTLLVIFCIVWSFPIWFGIIVLIIAGLLGAVLFS